MLFNMKHVVYSPSIPNHLLVILRVTHLTVPSSNQRHYQYLYNTFFDKQMVASHSNCFILMNIVSAVAALAFAGVLGLTLLVLGCALPMFGFVFHEDLDCFTFVFSVLRTWRNFLTFTTAAAVSWRQKEVRAKIVTELQNTRSTTPWHTPLTAGAAKKI